MHSLGLRHWVLGVGMGMAITTAAAAQGAPDASAKLRHLHDALSVSSDQEDAWSQYAAAMTQGADTATRRQAAEHMMPALPTPRRLALIDATMTQELADFHRQSAAIARLYDRLSPNQQRIFDHETAPQDDQGPDHGHETPR